MSDASSGAALPGGSSGQLAAGLGLVLTAFFWGAMVAFMPPLLDVLDPFLISFLRYGIAVPVLLACAWATDRRWPLTWHLPWKHITLLGAFGMAPFSTCFTVGIMLSDPVSAAIILSGGPLVASVLAWVMYRAPFQKGFGVSLGLALAGGVIGVFGSPKFTGSAGFRGGEALLIVGMLFWNWYSLKAQEWLGDKGIGQVRLSALTAIPGTFVFGVVFFGLAQFGLASYPARAMTGLEFGILMWMGCLGAGIGVALWNFGASRLSLPIASLYGNLSPVFTIAIAALVLGAPVSALQIVGGAAVLAGVMRIQILRLRAARAG